MNLSGRVLNPIWERRQIIDTEPAETQCLFKEGELPRKYWAAPLFAHPAALLQRHRHTHKKNVPFIFFPAFYPKASHLWRAIAPGGLFFHRQPCLLPKKQRTLWFSDGCAAKEELLTSTYVVFCFFASPPHPHPPTALLCSVSPVALSSSSSLHRWKLRRHPSSLLIGVLPDMVRCNYWCLILSGNAVH